MNAKHWSKFATLKLQNVNYRTQKRVKCFLEERKQRTNNQNQQIDFPDAKITNRKDKQNKKQKETTQLLIKSLGSFNSFFIGS